MIVRLPFIQNTLSLPPAAACLLFTAGMVLLSQAGFWLFNRWRRHEKLEKSNEVAGIIFGAIGLLYSLILAFVIVAEWNDYSDLQKNVEAETDKMNGILAHSSTLPDSLKNIIGTALYDYCSQVTGQEWKAQQTTTDHPSAIPILRQKLLTSQPATEVQARIFDVIDQNLSDITELRRARLSHTHSQMPQLIWQILKAGTVLLILFAYFLQVSSLTLKRIYLAFFVTSISICMFLVYSLDHPFDEQDGINKQPYFNVQQECKDYLPVQPNEEPELSQQTRLRTGSNDLSLSLMEVN